MERVALGRGGLCRAVPLLRRDADPGSGPVRGGAGGKPAAEPAGPGGADCGRSVCPRPAVPGGLDNTLKSVERVAAGNGFDSFIMCNVYAQRATRPGDMERELNPALHRENLAAFAYALSLSERPAVWAAWGTVIEQRPYLPRCVLDMVEVGKTCGARWFTAGVRSKRGHPHHPLYLRKDSVLEEFDAAAYCAGLLSGT